MKLATTKRLFIFAAFAVASMLAAAPATASQDVCKWLDRKIVETIKDYMQENHTDNVEVAVDRYKDDDENVWAVFWTPHDEECSGKVSVDANCEISLHEKLICMHTGWTTKKAEEQKEEEKEYEHRISALKNVVWDFVSKYFSPDWMLVQTVVVDGRYEAIFPKNAEEVWLRLPYVTEGFSADTGFTISRLNNPLTEQCIIQIEVIGFPWTPREWNGRDNFLRIMNFGSYRIKVNYTSPEGSRRWRQSAGPACDKIIMDSPLSN